MSPSNNDFLLASIQKLNLESLQARALEIVARDAIGMIQSVAASQVSSQSNRPRVECEQALLDLVGRGLLIRVDTDQPRLIAEYEKLGIPPEQRQLLVTHSRSFQVLGQPHSAEAMATLRALFEDAPEVIFVGMEVTAREVFTALEARSAAGRSTVFLMPPKSNVRSQRREHYDEVLDEWVRFLRKGRSHLRANVRLYISKEVTPEMYTSALTRDTARIDLYHFSAESTRTGHILQAPRGSSLYALVEARYRSALAYATPLFRVWPVRWFSAHLKRSGVLALGLVLLAIAGWLNWAFKRELGLTVIGGAAVNFIAQSLLTSRIQEMYR